MNVLILHHFSSYWENGFNNEGTSFENEMGKVTDYIKNTNIDQVILPLFEGEETNYDHYKLVNICSERGIMLKVTEYGYNWRIPEDEECYLEWSKENKEGVDWCKSTRDDAEEDNIVVIEDWQKELKYANKVLVAGAFEGQCVRDLEDALTAINISYERVEGLIVGAHIDYEYQGYTKETLADKIRTELSPVLDMIQEVTSDAEEFYDIEILDLEELHAYSSPELAQIEESVIDVIENYENDLVDLGMTTVDDLGLLTKIVDRAMYFDGSVEVYQVEHDDYAENLLLRTLSLIEDKNIFVTQNNNIKDLAINNLEEGKVFYEEIKEAFRKLREKTEFTTLISVNIEDNVKDVTKELWNDYITHDIPLDLDVISFIAKKENKKTPEFKNPRYPY